MKAVTLGEIMLRLTPVGYKQLVQAEALEADIKDLFVNKFDVPVTEVICAHDVSMYQGRGSGICDLETDERTYYGSVIVEQDEGELFKYELQFPGLDKDELDLG